MITLKKSFSVLLSLIIAFIAVIPVELASIKANAADYKEELINIGFPENYAAKLAELHSKYPNWIFKPLNTGLDWNTAVSGERSKHSNQLISKSAVTDSSYFCNCSECLVNGNYVIREASNWVSASQSAVEYYMDPRNFLDEQQIFQFESTAYDGTQSKSGVEAILNGTWMYNSLISYSTTSQSTKYYNNTTTYSDAIMKAASDFGINSYYIAAKIKQENGSPTPASDAVSGQVSPFQGIYNYFNIGAYSGAKDGLAWAAGFLRTTKDTVLYSSYDTLTNTPTGTTVPIASGQYMTWRANKGDNYYYVRLYNESNGSYTEGASGYIAKSDCRTTYLGDTASGYGRPWTNPYKAIYYGTKYIANSFKTQYTGYLQKFNVSPDSTTKYTNEYMKNVQAAAQEAVSSYNGYSLAGILSNTRTFYIPIYTNMPNTVGSTSVYVTDVSNNSVTVAWNTAEGANGYLVQISDENGNWYDYAYVAETSVTIQNLISAYRFGIRVKGYYQDAGGIIWGDTFASINAATKPDGTDITASSCTDNTVTLSWKKVSRASGYRIYQYNSSSKKYELIKSIGSGASKTSAKISGLKANKTYKFKVAAYKSADNIKYVGAKSSAKSVKTKNKAVTLKSAKSSNKKKISVSWKKKSGVSGYEVMWSTSSNFKKNFLSVKVSGASKTSKTLTTAKSKKNYYVRVRAYKKSEKKYTYYSWSKTIKVKVK